MTREPPETTYNPVSSRDAEAPEPADGDWVLPLPEPKVLVPVTEVKGMLIVASRQQLRTAGLFERYEESLEPNARGELVGITASNWVSMQSARAHFTAIEALSLADADVLAMTGAVAEKIHGAFLSTVAKTIRASGITPWSVVPIAARIWPKFLRGGAIGVRREGPKDARVVVVGNPLVRHRYHRLGWGAHLETAVHMVVARRVYTRVTYLNEPEGRLDYLLQWV